MFNKVWVGNIDDDVEHFTQGKIYMWMWWKLPRMNQLKKEMKLF